jgi:ribosome-associated toxin RatA of RatAB toxin-antitoxin module
MYDLVADIDAYQEFLPWCDGSEVLSRDAKEVTASLHIRFGSLNKSFSTRNTLYPEESLVMDLLDGPFSHLHGVWRFQALGEEGSRISLDMDFQFSSRMVDMVAAPAFTKIADGLVEAFCKRAVERYGKR